MIGKSNSENRNGVNDALYVIVYDKFTKPAAISLKNKLSKDAKCVAWNKKDYQGQENTITNKNKLILFNEDLIKENLASPYIKQGEILPGIDYKKEGNVLGIVYNENNSPKKLGDILKENWGKYVLGVVGPVLLVGGLPGAAVISYIVTRKEKNKIKIKLYMDAVNKLSSNLLKDLYNE